MRASGQLPADVGWRAMLPGRAHHPRHRAVYGSSLCRAAPRPPNCLRSVLAAPSFDARERSGRGPGICSSARLVAHTVPGRWRLRKRKQPSPAPAAHRQMDFPILLCRWLACRRHARSASERCLLTTQAMPLNLPGLPWPETCAADYTLHILGTPRGRAAPGQAQCRCRDQPARWLAISTTYPKPHILLSSLPSLPQRSRKLPIPTA